MKKEEFKSLYLNPNNQEFNKALNDIIKVFCELEIDELNRQRLEFIDKLIEKSRGLEPSMLSYSSITAMTFNFEDNNGQLSEIGTFLREALNEHFEKNVNEEYIHEEENLANQYKVVKKSIEHLDLAINQKKSLYNEQHDELYNIKRVIVSFNKKMKNADRKINKSYNKLKEIDGIKNKIYTEFVAILGIFASIIFGVFGGFQEIQLIGKNLNTTPIPKLLIFSSLVMLGVTLIIFLCFNAISKITNMPMRSCNCKAGECNCSFRKRHPTIFYSSCIYLYVLLVGFALRLYKYNDFKFSDLYNGILKGYDILPLLLLILPLIPLLIALIIYGDRKRKEYSYKKQKEKRAKNS
ncbi:hypothetical protein [Staphylococcus hominis]|uniref:hypothetical protein n=1 Tax=Staphylococcus hominis TaxID=1290 RepID=UPI0006B9B7F4|nr:hypothetical protein [Staphylococcus hominis]MCI2919672.1 hypothetical protein [Staphylococcus hominis]MDS3927808.1 hypothetical protein [Staphylococcus hominis]OFN18180.1 hypothetical protein HMPREF2612_03265 [Staphylococcus sp. HMSC058D09]